MFTIECGLVNKKIEDVVQSLLYMCLYGVCSLNLIEPHTNQT